VLLPHEQPFAQAEFRCPASDEMGHRTTCDACALCRGTSSPARSVAIVAHGKPTSLKAWGIHGDFFGRQAKSRTVPLRPVAPVPALRSKDYRPREVSR
jgi:hypothetical protein